MLKTNSKKAKENVKAYIIDNFIYDNYAGYRMEEAPSNFDAICNEIYSIFIEEMVKHDKRNLSEQAYFVEWCQGLPSVLDTCYYYNRSAVNDLGAILEESEEEKARFTESQAESMLTYLIYREILANKRAC